MSATGPGSPAPTVLSCGDSPLSITGNIVALLTFALGLFASYIALASVTRGAPKELSRLVDELRSTQTEINRVAAYIFDDAHEELSRDWTADDASDEDEEKGTRKTTTNGEISHHAPPPRQNTGFSIDSLQPPPPAAAPPRRANTFSSNTSSIFPASGILSTRPGPGPNADVEASSFTDLPSLYAETQKLLASCISLFYEADTLLKRSQSASERWSWDPEGLRRMVVFVLNRHEVAEKMQRLAEQKAKLGAVQTTLFMRRSVLQDATLREVVRRCGRLEIMLSELRQDTA